MSSPHPLAPGSNTSSPSVPAPSVDTQVILLPIVLPTPPIFVPRLSIMTQLTQPAYNFTNHNYIPWASGFKLFLESHNFHHHLMDGPPSLYDLSYASWSQSNSAIFTWMLHIIEQSIAESLECIKSAHCLWQTLKTMYANQTNIDRVLEIFESLFTCKQSELSLQAHFGRLQALIQEVELCQPPTTNLVTFKRYNTVQSSMLESILVGFIPLSPLSLGALFSLVIVSMASLPFSLLLFESLPLSSTLGDTPPPSLFTTWP